jgi:hypothetical protein
VSEGQDFVRPKARARLQGHSIGYAHYMTPEAVLSGYTVGRRMRHARCR